MYVGKSFYIDIDGEVVAHGEEEIPISEIADVQRDMNIVMLVLLGQVVLLGIVYLSFVWLQR